MAIIWNKLIPRWGGDTIEPPEAKKDIGYIAGDNPPATWENWLRKGTYEALDETRDVIENIDSQLAQFESYSLNLMSGNLSLPGTSLTEYKLPFTTQGNIVDYTEIVLNSDGDIKIKKNGTYLIIADATFSIGGNGFRKINILENGTTVSTTTVPPTASNWTTAMQTIALINCVPNDLIAVTASQNSGTSLDVVCVLKIKKVG